MSASTRFFYGVGSVAFGVKDNGFAFFLLLYYNQVLGLSAQLTSLAILLALVVDAISDPIVGNISDRLHSRWGRRHPFMYASALPVALAYFFLWNPPSYGETGLFLHLLGVAVLVRTFITFYEVPSSALAPELTDDYDERTTLTTLRHFFGWAGGIGLSVLTYALLLVPTDDYPVGQLNPAGYQTYGIVAAVIMLLAVLASTLGTHRHIPNLKAPPPKRRASLRATAREFAETLSNRSFFSIFGYGFFAAAAGGLMASMTLYFNTFFWGLRSDQLALIVPSGFVSAFIAVGLAPAAAARLGKKPAAIGLSVCAGILAPIPIGLRFADIMPANGTTELLVCLVIYNIAEIALIISSTSLVSAMMADVVEESELVTGRRSEGVFFAARSFISKSMTGIGIVMGTLLLTVVGFPDKARPGEVDPAVIVRLGLGYVPMLISLYLAAIACLFGYRITREQHAENLAELDRRSAQPTH